MVVNHMLSYTPNCVSVLCLRTREANRVPCGNRPHIARNKHKQQIVLFANRNSVCLVLRLPLLPMFPICVRCVRCIRVWMCCVQAKPHPLYSTFHYVHHSHIGSCNCLIVCNAICVPRLVDGEKWFVQFGVDERIAPHGPTTTDNRSPTLHSYTCKIAHSFQTLFRSSCCWLAWSEPFSVACIFTLALAANPNKIHESRFMCHFTMRTTFIALVPFSVYNAVIIIC